MTKALHILLLFIAPFLLNGKARVLPAWPVAPAEIPAFSVKKSETWCGPSAILKKHIKKKARVRATEVPIPHLTALQTFSRSYFVLPLWPEPPYTLLFPYRFNDERGPPLLS
jgi:hypothetical protein